MNTASEAPGNRGHVLCRWCIRLAGTGVIVIMIAFVCVRLAVLGPFPAMLGMTLGTLALILGGILAAAQHPQQGGAVVVHPGRRVHVHAGEPDHRVVVA